MTARPALAAVGMLTSLSACAIAPRDGLAALHQPAGAPAIPDRAGRPPPMPQTGDIFPGPWIILPRPADVATRVINAETVTRIAQTASLLPGITLRLCHHAATGSTIAHGDAQRDIAAWVEMLRRSGVVDAAAAAPSACDPADRRAVDVIVVHPTPRVSPIPSAL